MAATVGFDESQRRQEAIEFDKSRAGVKGLIDAGVAKIPSIFIQPPEHRPSLDTRAVSTEKVPVISLDGPRSEVVSQIRDAAETWGFFQIINHGVPLRVTNGIVEGIRRFMEQPTEVKQEFYTRDKKVKFYSTSALHVNSRAHWRDTLAIEAENTIDPELIPLACRDIFMEYLKYLVMIKDTLCELLSEALGLPSDYLASIGCMERQRFMGHYYPQCPQPELALGLTKHTDASFITVLVQDNVGGLQVLHDDKWVNVTPLEGAYVINIGDWLQLLSNDKFKSAWHRVLATAVGVRISVASNLFPSEKHHYETTYGPIKELLSDKNPPVYREITPKEYDDKYLARGMDGSQVLDKFRI